MTWNEMKDLCRHVAGRVKATWANSPYGNVGALAVRRRQLIDQLNARYGVLRNETTKQVAGLTAKLSVKPNASKQEKVDNVS